ncbi:MAG TPA: dienelactone hydrolase family protein [Acidobacteriaceae bacterium]
MGETVKISVTDGHQYDAYVAQPEGMPKAALVVLQEIFGVSRHIRRMTDSFAAQGYYAVAPALFDRYERGVDLGSSPADWEKALSFVRQINMSWAQADVEAAVNYARDEYKTEVGVVGFCLGGSLAWLAAAHLPIGAAVGYYGGYIARFLDQRPQVPILLHFGNKDEHIPPEDVAAIEAAYPEVPVYLYDAGHAFDRQGGPTYDAAASALALDRTLAFLAQHLTMDSKQPLQD